MKFIFSYMKKYKWLVALAMGIKLVGSLTELMIPYVLEYMIDEVAPKKNVWLIVAWGVVMVFLAFAVRTINTHANRRAVKISKACIYEIRQDLFTKTINLSGDQMDEVGLPSLISRMTSDSYNLQSFIQSFQTLGARAPIILLGGIIVTMTMDFTLSMILVTISIFLLVLIFFISRKGIPLYNKVQEKLDDVVRVMRENITGVRVVKALSKENYEKNRFSKVNEEMNRAERKASVIMALPGPTMQLFMNCSLVLVILVGAVKVNKGLTQPGVILAFLSYFQMILLSVMTLNRFFLMLSKANASATRIEKVMERPEGLATMEEREETKAPTDDYIIFRHVSFSYGKAETMDAAAFAGQSRAKTLEEIDFSIRKGGSLGIIGATGSGKTTILNLLMRFYDPTEGQVFVDGKDVRTYDLDTLRRKFGVVFQNDFIFADTVYDNISLGRGLGREEVAAAAKDAMASSFLEAYPEQYDHLAAIHGANFSGGQKQRILLSRAFAGSPEILILDDSSSALDYRTDAELRKNIRENHREATTIVVAQRVSSIMTLDHILMIDEGRIIGYGTHEELLSSCPEYKAIHETQMGEM